ncbi:uncharacterized protein LOC114525641 [Dendronephthya gigantea]|uniref:uncharacterized protein LOC114525641 n=1 Tax=Dendronephthya gigantea TaxID=151771 RepID=UPI00106CC9DA|nr:uncharacterized protein LOC114525641 [Dendronephthya gigantea]
MSNLWGKPFTVYMYEQEIRFLEWLVLRRQNIETGGDLFGLWQSEDTVIVQLVIGPGEGCSRTQTSFHQDVDYLSRVGEKLTKSQGLCNIGEWHSHHRIGMPTPSYGDQTTVWSNMDSVAGGRFLVFIASISDSFKKPSVSIRCFMFTTKDMSEGSLQILQGYSPIRGQFNDVAPGPEQGVGWEDFVKNFESHHSSSTKKKKVSRSPQKRQPRTPPVGSSTPKFPTSEPPTLKSATPKSPTPKSAIPKSLIPKSPTPKSRTPKSLTPNSPTKNDTRETNLENGNMTKYGSIIKNEKTNGKKKPQNSKNRSKTPKRAKKEKGSTTESDDQTRLLRDFASPLPNSASDIESSSSWKSKFNKRFFILVGVLVLIGTVVLVVVLVLNG